MRPRLILPALGILVLVPSPALTYPISPVPLWDLVEKSAAVVLADVVEIRDADPSAPITSFHAGSVAHLRVREVWKGPRLEMLDVRFSANMICPAPPRYVKGRLVLAFLSAGNGYWFTTALSYGTLYPRLEDLETFRSMVAEAVELQRVTPVALPDVMEWHVKAASMPATRWHGLYRLVPQSDRLHYFYEQWQDGVHLAGIPTTAQLRQIAVAFSATPATDRTLPMLLTLLRGFQDQGVDKAALSSIEALLSQEKPPWWIKDALYLTLERFHDAGVEERLAPLGDVFDDVTPEQARLLWKTAKKELALPDVPAARIIEEDVRGVGSNTPS